MRIKNFASFIQICLILLSGHVISQDKWELKKDKNSIQIYTRKVAGSQFKAFRGVTTVTAPLSALVAVFQDVETYADWMPNTKEATLLERQGDTEHHQYMEMPAPWPIANRDAIYRFRYIQDPTTKMITLEMIAVPGYHPEKQGIVRIKKAMGLYRFIPRENGKIRILFEMHTEPGGNIPAWLVNWRIVDAPYNTLKRLKERVYLQKYQDQSFSFLK